MPGVLLLALFCISFSVSAQFKKPLTHDVYDGWMSPGERLISDDGNIIVYAINPQAGDGNLYIKKGVDSPLQAERGNGAVITHDNQFVIFKVRPPYQVTRQARIDKKKPDGMPRDSLFIWKAGDNKWVKIPRVKSFKTPEKAGSWLAYTLEKPLPDTTKKKAQPDSVKVKIDMLTKMADSIIRRSLDSVKGKIEKEKLVEATNKAVKEIYKKAYDTEMARDAEGDDPATGSAGEGNKLVLRNLLTGKELNFSQVTDYYFDELGTALVLETSAKPKDTTSKAALIFHHLASGVSDTIMQGFSDATQFSFDEAGRQLAFVAEKDSSKKSLVKWYKLYYYRLGYDSAVLLADKNTIGMRLGNTISENGKVNFSKDGSRIFFGLVPQLPARDTSLVDFELARLDIWHYKDDYLQPQQLKELNRRQREYFTAVIMPGGTELLQLNDDSTENISLVDEGNANWALAQSNTGNRIQMQWEGRSNNTAYLVNTSTGRRKKIAAALPAFYQASPAGKFVYWYNAANKNYYTYNVATGTTLNISAGVKEPLYDIENDLPDYPRQKGTISWQDNDSYIYVKGVYDIWKLDPLGKEKPVNLTKGYGLQNKIEFDYLRTDREKRFFTPGEAIYLSGLNKTTKDAGYYTIPAGTATGITKLASGKYDIGAFLKAKDSDKFLVQQNNISSAELYTGTSPASLQKITDIASQQKDYNWLTSELVRWKMLDGKMSEGILYKPENFDPKKKYPVIFYFYERNSDDLNLYKTPAPSASIINIPYFVSNGYLVFDPNIYYKNGEPGQSAYNSVVSAARYLARMPWVDSTRMGIQGQSWGGYQVAYLVTRTNMFRAAGAGAPVSNMTSAYGGIRWGTGLNRQFQYEKSQSRIGATLWQRPDLYIKNSPLFAADKIKTPLLIMHNDADGAVPWYQGIELFTALRRLDKKVWMLQYNGEDHNLVERRNRKDLSVRLSQFFDYYLKDAPPARWITEGLPATEKGRSWGLETE